MRHVLLDTIFVQALLNKSDDLHERAKALLPLVTAAAQVVVTEAVLVEIGNAFSRLGERARLSAVEYVRSCYQTPNTRVITVDTPLMTKGLKLYEARPDKEWGFTDCISFAVMDEHGLKDAVTSDHHFQQAGYVALM